MRFAHVTVAASRCPDLPTFHFASGKRPETASAKSWFSRYPALIATASDCRWPSARKLYESQSASSKKRPGRTEVPVFSFCETPRSIYLNDSPAVEPFPVLLVYLHPLQLIQSQRGSHAANRDRFVPDWPRHFRLTVSIFKPDRPKLPAIRDRRKQRQRFYGQTVRPSHRLYRIPGRILRAKCVGAIVGRVPSQ